MLVLISCLLGSAHLRALGASRVNTQRDVLTSDTDAECVRQKALGPETHQVTKNMALLGRDLMLRIFNPRKNFVFSVFSISTAMGMVSLGAAGSTRKQLEKGIHLGPNYQAGYSSLTNFFHSQEENISTSLFNALFVQKTLPIVSKFKQEIQCQFQGAVKLADFVHSSAQERKNINRIIKEETKGKIKNLLGASAITPETVMVLINTIYFKGEWMESFTMDTKRKAFEINAGRSVLAQFMHQRRNRHFIFRDQRKTIVRLAYKGNMTAMYLVLPSSPGRRVLRELALDLSLLHEFNVDKMEESLLALKIPQFRIESSFYLAEAFKKMGINDAFDKDLANFKNMAEVTHGRLFLSSVVHKASVEVTEMGTVAAASSGVVATLTRSLGESLISIIFNRPFLFYIQLEPGVILFQGIVQNPAVAV